MKLKEIIELLNAKVIVDGNIENVEIEKVTASDLMSDVLALGEEGSLLVTGLSSPQCIRTAGVVGIPAVLIVRNRDTMPETIEAAKLSGIILLSTKYSMFETCGILYAKGLKPVKV
ncbi:MAG: hypothetical protein J7J43_07830 [Thermosipho sp. (in: Bacteria)]|nr:hypothetical protein [Thermosipho sp. (in: thermotogales)]MCD6105662.1 hypothetical protein [Thermosipho sp. (in: thermotogales)]